MLDPFDWREWARFTQESCGSPCPVDMAYEQERAERGRQFGISAWDNAVFESFDCPCGSIHDEQCLSKHMFWRPQNEDLSLVAGAIRHCLEMGWIQWISQEQIRQLHRELVESGYAMPSGLFGSEDDVKRDWARGQMTYTALGWKTVIQFWSINSTSRWVPCGKTTDEEFMVYGATREAIANAEEFYSHEADCLAFTLREDGVAWPDDSGSKLLELEPCSRWCDRWYQRFESGYRARFWQRVDPRRLEDSQPKMH